MEPKTLYGKYILERENKFILEKEYGFATYIYENDYMYVIDIFVVKEERRNKKSKELHDELVLIAKANGKNKLIGSVCSNANGATESLKFLLSHDFKLLHNDNSMIYFSKEI